MLKGRADHARQTKNICCNPRSLAGDGKDNVGFNAFAQNQTKNPRALVIQ